jgi:uncharacterized repeat protein (TIGR02543 family)
MKNKLLFTLAFLSGMLVSCGSATASSVVDTTSSTSTSQTTTYTVTFANTSMSSVSIEEGSKLTRPTDPVKDGYIFEGWYEDSSFSKEVSFPLTINSDITIYAAFNSYQTAFKKAREKTIGDDVNGYEFDYNIDASATVKKVSVSGKTKGNTKYSKNGDVKYLDSHVNSGLLFNDGTIYQVRKGNTLAKIGLDEKGELTKYKLEDVESTYKFDSSNFAKAIFEYSDDQLKSISKTSVANEYKLKTSFNISTAISLVGNYLNHPLVEKLIGEMPETSVDTGMYVTFSNGELKNYRYEMNISVSQLTFSLTYNLTFKNVGVAPTIVAPNYDNVSFTKSDISNTTEEIKNAISSYKAKEHSAYDFVVKTGVDHGISELEINSTFQGSTKRKVTSSNTYSWTEVEVDTDYKNADLYKNKGIVDLKYKRIRLTDDTMYEFKKGLLSYDDGTVVTERENDNYYLLDVMDNISTPSFLKKAVVNDVTTYTVGLTTEGIKSLLNWLNNNLLLNPYETATYTPVVFGTFNEDSLNVKKSSLVITLTGGELTSISLSSSGRFETAFEESRDFYENKKAVYDFTYSLTTTSKGDSYEPVETAKEAKKL